MSSLVLNDLPYEIQQNIILFTLPKKTCDFYSWKNMRLVNHSFYNIIMDKNTLYKYLSFIRKYINIEDDFYETHEHIDTYSLYRVLFQKLINNYLIPYYKNSICSHGISLDTIIDLPIFKITDKKDILTVKREYEIITKFMETSKNRVYRGVNLCNNPFIILKLYDRTKDSYKIEYLYFHGNEWHYYSNNWNCANDKHDISYIGSISHRTKHIIDDYHQLCYYEDGCVLDSISFNYLKRLMYKEKCGIPLKRSYMVTSKRYGDTYEKEVFYYIEGTKEKQVYEHGLTEHLLPETLVEIR